MYILLSFVQSFYASVTLEPLLGIVIHSRTAFKQRSRAHWVFSMKKGIEIELRSSKKR